MTLHNFKRRDRKAVHPAVAVRHPTGGQGSFMPLMIFMVVCATFFIGFYTGLVMQTGIVFSECARTGHWNWESPLLIKQPDLDCKVPHGLAFETELNSMLEVAADGSHQEVERLATKQ